MKKYGFGVDIGGTTVKMSLFEMTGHMVDKWEIPTNTQDHGSSILSDVAAVIEGRLVQDGISKDDVEGIGIGVPGPVVQDSVVTECVNLGWGRVDVAKELAEKTGLKVRVGNDANVAALGEMWQGGGKGYKNVIMITLGTGVGGGIIINGNVINGSNGAGGENAAVWSSMRRQPESFVWQTVRWRRISGKAPCGTCRKSLQRPYWTLQRQGMRSLWK